MAVEKIKILGSVLELKSVYFKKTVARISFLSKFWCRISQIGFQLLDLILPELKSHVIPYKFKSSHWLRANLVKDFFLQMNFPPMRALEFIRDHMTFKLRYNQI